MKKHTAKLTAHKATLIACASPAEIQVEAADAQGNVNGPAKFSSVAYSGGKVPGYTATPRLPHDFVIELSTTKAVKSPKANLDHKTTQRVGQVNNTDNDGKQLSVQGTLSAATNYRDEVLNSHKDGFEWEVSGEFALGKLTLIPKGQSAMINGQKFDGPIFRASNNKFTDIAFVSHGADGGNQVNIAASAVGASDMNEFETFMVSCGVDPETATEAQKAILQEAFDARKSAKLNGAGNPQISSFTEMVAEERANRDRCAAIYKLGQEAMKLHPTYIEHIEGMAKLAMDNRATQPEHFELELLRALRTTTGSFHGRDSRPEADPKLIECALAMASGLPKIEEHYSEEVLNRVDMAGMQHISLQQVLLETASANGYSCRGGMRIHDGNIREVLQYCFPTAVQARLSGFSAISLTGILGNVANKEILVGYKEEDNTWEEISAVKPVSNFYLVTSYRMLDSLEYEEVGPTGFIKHGVLDQESYTRQAKTYAKMLGLTRTDIINDDLGAFDDIRQRLGMGAAKKFNNIFWTAFMNNASFFVAGNTNYVVGATTTLLQDGVGLGLGELGFAKMTSPVADSSKRVGAGSRPAILLHPPELAVNARSLYKSQNFVTGASSTIAGQNVFQGLYRPVIQNRLSDSAFTGNSAVAWYLFGDQLKPMVVSFLNGKRTPTVESADADFNQLGIQFRAYHDFGADKSEYLAGVKVKGAA